MFNNTSTTSNHSVRISTDTAHLIKAQIIIWWIHSNTSTSMEVLSMYVSYLCIISVYNNIYLSYLPITPKYHKYLQYVIHINLSYNQICV